MTEGRYCAYLRKSRADAVREQLEPDYDALAHHRQALTDLSTRMRVQIEKWYTDGIKSGDSIEQRPQMQQLLSDIESGMWDGVLCMEIERLTRGSMIDQGIVGNAFAQSGTLIVTPLKVYDPSLEADMEYFEFGMFMSRREYKTIKKRLYQGRIAAASEGQFIGSDAPYGYDKAVIDGKHTLIPNKEARFVVTIFEEYAKGTSYRKIAHMLDTLGAMPKRGAKWNQNSIRNVVRNTVYIGRITWGATKQVPYRENGRTRHRTEYPDEYIDVKGLHEPIISQDLWDAACRRTEAAPVRGDYQHRNMFGRILVCAECGRALHWQKASHAGGADMYVHKGKGEGCTTKGCSAKRLESLFADAVASCAHDFEIGAQTVSGDRREDFEKAIAEAQAAIEANFDRMERGIISEEDFVRRRVVLNQRIADAESAIDSLPNEADEAKSVMFKECLEALKDERVSVEEKRRLVWAIVDRIEYINHGEPHIEVYLR